MDPFDGASFSRAESPCVLIGETKILVSEIDLGAFHPILPGLVVDGVLGESLGIVHICAVAAEVVKEFLGSFEEVLLCVHFGSLVARCWSHC